LGSLSSVFRNSEKREPLIGDVAELALGFFGEPVALPPTTVRSQWTAQDLYFFFTCPYRKLHLKPNPVTTSETDRLWNWDVAEAFIGSDFANISRYKEFQVSPQGEFVDLDIDREHPERQQGVPWQSGFQVAARIDEVSKVWYGQMRIPFASLGVDSPTPGTELRLGLFRIEGPEPDRTYVSWRATGTASFHVPSAFGTLVLR
jgi:hypothetical protein